MQKIIPNLWFNRNAKEAVDYYLSVFKDSKLIGTTYHPKEGLEDFQLKQKKIVIAEYAHAK